MVKYYIYVCTAVFALVLAAICAILAWYSGQERHPVYSPMCSILCCVGLALLCLAKETKYQLAEQGE